MKPKAFALIMILALVLGSGVAWLIVRADNSPGLELTKDEALKAMNLQYTVVMATTDRDEYVRALYAKYGLTPQTHNLNVASGSFVTVEKKAADAKK